MTEGMPRPLDLSEAGESLRGLVAQTAAGTPSADETQRWIDRAREALLNLQHGTSPDLGEDVEAEWVGFRHESGMTVFGQDATVQAEWNEQGPTRFAVETRSGSWHVAWGPEGARFVETGKEGEPGLDLRVTPEGRVSSGEELFGETGATLRDVVREELGKIDWKDDDDVASLEETPPSARSEPPPRSGPRVVEAGAPAGAEEEPPDPAPSKTVDLCSECGAERQEEAKFCMACGARFQPRRPESCPRCQSKLVADAAFCPQCGVRIEDAIRETETSEAETETSGSETKWVEVPEQEEDIEDEGAEAKYADDEGLERFEGVEGFTDLDGATTYEEPDDDELPEPEPEPPEEDEPAEEPEPETDDEPTAPPVEEPPAEETVCPECDTPRKPKAKFCKRCGHRYEQARAEDEPPPPPPPPPSDSTADAAPQVVSSPDDEGAEGAPQPEAPLPSPEKPWSFQERTTEWARGITAGLDKSQLPPAVRGLLTRMIRAVFLDKTVYREVAENEKLHGEAWGITGAVILSGSVGFLIFSLFSFSMSVIVTLLSAVLVQLIVWLIRVWLIQFLAASWLKKKVTFDQLFRAIAYAQVPALLLLVPVVGQLLGLWCLATNTTAIRDVTGCDTWSAVILAVLGYAGLWVATLLARQFI